nr:fatty-acid-binding protein 1 [Tanacetum cinerariifolium]
MVSFRFPFSIPPLPTGIIISPARIACSVALTAGISAGISVSQNSTSVQNTLNSFVYKKPCFGSLSLSEGGVDVAVKEEKSGVVFPGVVEGNKGLLGVGLRRKVLFGLKNIDVYAFGVYADDSDIKNFLNEKYATLSATELKNADITQDLMESDVSVTIRLQIVYGKLSIRSVRNAFEDSVGTRLKKFGGSDNKELLQK